MPDNTALQRRTMATGETRTGQVDCQGKLRSGVTISSVSSVSASGLTITNAQANASALTINGVSVAAGKAIQFTISGGTVNTDYTLTATCVLSNGETIVFYLPFRVDDE